MQNFVRIGWTALGHACMVCALLSPAWAQEPATNDLRDRLRRVEVSRDAAEKQAAALQAALMRVEAALAASRQQFTDAHLQAKQLREDTQFFTVRAASLLATGEELAESAALARYSADMRAARQQYEEVARGLAAAAEQVDAVLAALPADRAEAYGNVIRQQLTETRQHLEELGRILPDNKEALPPPAAWRVLTTSDELQVVVVNAGRDQGIRPGQVLEIVEGGGDGSRLQVIEVRDSICAATVVSGQLRHITPGAELKRLPGTVRKQ
jgi:hypothetical protein